jgi:hypothetical protein
MPHFHFAADLFHAPLLPLFFMLREPGSCCALPPPDGAHIAALPPVSAAFITAATMFVVDCSICHYVRFCHGIRAGAVAFAVIRAGGVTPAHTRGAICRHNEHAMRAPLRAMRCFR